MAFVSHSLSIEQDVPFIDKFKHWNWSIDSLRDWFYETASFHMETLGVFVGGGLVLFVVIFILLHLDATKHATGYFLGSIMQGTLKSIFSLLTVGLGLSLYWLKNQMVARTRNLFRSIKNLLS